MKWLRSLFEKLVYAGMKPGAKPSDVAPSENRLFGSFRDRLNRAVAGPAVNDPLYVSNQGIGKRVLTAIAVAAPFAAIITVLYMSATGKLSAPPAEKKADLKPAEIADQMLPNLKDVQIKMSQDVVVIEAHVERKPGGVTLTGAIKNVTNRRIQRADVLFELTDSAGSQLGSTTARVDSIPADQSVQFSLPVAMPRAAFAIVREVHSR